jgi:hypothetical protein
MKHGGRTRGLSVRTPREETPVRRTEGAGPACSGLTTARTTASHKTDEAFRYAVSRRNTRRKAGEFPSLAAQSKYLVGSIRFHQLAQIWFSAARQHCLTSCITQAQDRFKISSAGLERIEYFNVDAPARFAKDAMAHDSRSRAGRCRRTDLCRLQAIAERVDKN